MQRDKHFEQGMMRAVGARDRERLSRLSAERADAGGSTIPDEWRDLEREVFEELADAANYLIWWLQRIFTGEETDDDPAVLLAALRGVVEIARGLEPPKLPRTHMMAGAKRPAPRGAFREGGHNAA